MPASHHRRIHRKSLHKWLEMLLFHPFPPCGFLSLHGGFVAFSSGHCDGFNQSFRTVATQPGEKQWHTCPNHVTKGASFQSTAVKIDEYLNVFHSVSFIVTSSMQKVCNYAVYTLLVHIDVRQSVSCRSVFCLYFMINAFSALLSSVSRNSFVQGLSRWPLTAVAAVVVAVAVGCCCYRSRWHSGPTHRPWKFIWGLWLRSFWSCRLSSVCPATRWPLSHAWWHLCGATVMWWRSLRQIGWCLGSPKRKPLAFLNKQIQEA